MENDNILQHVVDVLAAYVSSNTVSSEELPALITVVYNALKNLDTPETLVDEKREPAVSIRASIKPESITCLECGKRFKMLKRHLICDHGITTADYKERWNLPSGYPMVAPQSAQTRKELAVKIGLGHNRAEAENPSRRKKLTIAG
ncbi:MucR family transcriptional regulator [Aquisediminimonas sediminicola]|uniref:MucR family transcriptional regulator n=1 Tax=Alteraquisediminimonas sediminicola TaxID=2676787 RepID=UPI001C8DF852|nr:MucR family transcriptional regulator [Aquisediminimonas sediminicola]